MEGLLQGKTVLITGASSGIGEAAARALSHAGAEVFLTARREEKLDSLKRELTAAGGKALSLACDITDESAPEAIVSACVGAFGKLDILINNAGRAINRPVWETTPAEWDAVMTLNARVPFLMCKSAFPYLKASPEATVINVGSTVGINTYAGQSAYGASKHALRGFTQAFSKEVYPFGIRVHLLAPGAVDTDLISDVRPDLSDRTGLSRPEELADAILFLLTHRNNSSIDELVLRRSSKKPWD
jgi:3-oxoacyl-[acyl-carrier protein] reductase